MGSPRLRLFGTIHVDRPSKVADELLAYADGVDALFIELPPERPDWRTWATCLVRTPAALVTVLALQLFFAPVIVALTRQYRTVEGVAVERVLDELEVPVHRVDRPYGLIAEAGRGVVAVNWLAVAAVAVFAPAAAATTVATILATSALFHASLRYRHRLAWLCTVPLLAWGALGSGILAGLLSLPVLVVLYLAFGATLTATLRPRNEHMLDRIAEISASEGYENACLVTGKAHLSGLIALAEGYQLVVTHSKPSKWLRRSEAVSEDPDPDDGDWADRVSWPSEPEPAMGTEGGLAGRRLLAAVVDLVVLTVLVPVGAIAFGVVVALAVGREALEPAILGGLVGVLSLYHPLLESRLGRTPGKRFAGLVVVRADGSSCSFVRALVRHVARPFEVLLFGIGLAALVVSRRARRIGDRMAGTVVVRTAGSADGGVVSEVTDAAKDLSGDRPTSES